MCHLSATEVPLAICETFAALHSTGDNIDNVPLAGVACTNACHILVSASPVTIIVRYFRADSRPRVPAVPS